MLDVDGKTALPVRGHYADFCGDLTNPKMGDSNGRRLDYRISDPQRDVPLSYLMSPAEWGYPQQPQPRY